MRNLRSTLDHGKAAYQATRYPGNLAAELLPARRGMAWRLWIIPSAIAALLALTLWMQRPAPQNPTFVVKPDPNQLISTGPTSRPSLTDLRGIQYALYVTQVRTGVEDAMSQLSNGVDAALDAPVVTDSVKTVRSVAGEIQELASVTWSQLKPRSPGC